MLEKLASMTIGGSEDEKCMLNYKNGLSIFDGREFMVICPLDYRYGREEMKTILSEENRLRMQLKVEAALALAHAKLGDFSMADAKLIAAACEPGCVSIDRVKEIELETKHDVMAMVKAITENSGKAGKYVHLGATSNDIVDTATALQLKSAIDLLEDDVDNLILALSKLAKKHRNTIMVARTHGQFAIPTTFGFKIAGFMMEMLRHKDRLREVRKRAAIGKMSGAVGTGAAFGKNAKSIQIEVMKQLNLGYEEAATQIVCRDRYAEVIGLLALICTSCERYATEVRNLQRSEIQEVSEAFDSEKQVGSSTMAQKKNPITSENICGLARIARGFLYPALEDMVLWHERDLTNSSAERFIIPHVFVLTDDILTKTEEVFSTLVVRPANMRRNIELSKGTIMAEAVMIALVDKGIGRQDAHAIVRKASLEAEKKEVDLIETLMATRSVKGVISQKEMVKIMDPRNYVGNAPSMVDEIVKLAEKRIRKG
jgi:adenylosuccinate lyase